jgi:hypothetical protein
VLPEALPGSSFPTDFELSGLVGAGRTPAAYISAATTPIWSGFTPFHTESPTQCSSATTLAVYHGRLSSPLQAPGCHTTCQCQRWRNMEAPRYPPFRATGPEPFWGSVSVSDGSIISWIRRIQTPVDWLQAI